MSKITSRFLLSTFSALVILSSPVEAWKPSFFNGDGGGKNAQKAANYISMELQRLEDKIQETPLSEEAREKALSEFERLCQTDFMSAEAAEIRKYLNNLLDLPWAKEEATPINITEAEKVLNEDHACMTDVKERIIEQIVIQNRVGLAKAPILCFVGAPGVGKTSLARSISRATGRPLQRISLGGVRDEAAIRGHMRTYVGSTNGRILEALKNAKQSNALILLDEIDKIIDSNVQGDPQAALLEVLDPEQNINFKDHYLDVGFDLSNVMFIATANDLSKLSRPLLDRMEIIYIPGYSLEEKLQIAKQHIVPKQLKTHGLTDRDISITDDALRFTIDGYTREAGARNLERQIAVLCRKASRELHEAKSPKPILVDTAKAEQYLGVPHYLKGDQHEADLVGISNGLSWSEVGGDVLTIETAIMPGEGKITSTGSLGDVMSESVKAACTYIRSRAKFYNIDPEMFKTYDIHIHVPEGATPKDGPSAGTALFSSILSALLNKPLRHDVAMTGEITLRGRVLPIGGLKEKLLGAKRNGIKKVLIPLDNKKDLRDIPSQYLEGLEIVFVNHADEVIPHIFVAGEKESMNQKK
ncbi:MAG: endopeptidase La [Candidatus Nucleicultricaceae bacterium]